MKTNKINVVLSLNKTTVSNFENDKVVGAAASPTVGSVSCLISFCGGETASWWCEAKTRTTGQTIKPTTGN